MGEPEIAGPTAVPVRLARWPRPVFTIVSLIVVVCVGVAGLTVGYELRSSTEQQIRTASLPVVATAKLKYLTRVLDAVTGTVAAAAGYQFVPATAAFPGPIVVTNSGVGLGAALSSGSLIASINDHPVFGLTLQTNLWRDLTLADTGTDVLAVNTALSGLGYLRGKATNVYSTATAAAITAMYRKVGLAAASAAPTAGSVNSATSSTSFSGATGLTPAPALPGSFLAISSIANIPTPALVVSQVVPVGSVVAAGAPVMGATGVENLITTKIDILHQQQIKVGTVVDLQETAGAGLGPGTVTSIGLFSAGDTTKGGIDALNGYPMTVSFPTSSATVAVKSGDQVQLRFPALSKRELAVPTVSIRHSTGSSQVLIKVRQKYRLVAVTPLWQQDGWTGIDKAAAVKIGDAVVVSGK